MQLYLISHKDSRILICANGITHCTQILRELAEKEQPDILYNTVEIEFIGTASADIQPGVIVKR